MPKCTIPMLACDSSQLKEFGYDPITKTLAIRFHAKKGPGSVYLYQNVPQEVADGLRAADGDPEGSVGRFFGEHIKPFKDKFPFTKLVEDEEQAPA